MIESSSALSLTLFGSIQIERQGRPLSALATDKAGALLAYLVVEGTPQRRETLAALFWPEMNEQRARANLSQALYVLRKACASTDDEPPLLLTDARIVQLNPAAPLVCDFLQLRQSLAGCPSHHPQVAEECAACCTALQQGVDRCQGEFLNGLSLADCPEFEAWLRTQRTLLLHQTVTALQRLVRWHEQRGAQQAALTAAQKLVTLEPFDEAAQLLLLRLLIQNGQRSAALSAFEHYRTLLQQELNSEPGRPLLQFYQQIKADESGARRVSMPAPLSTAFVGRSAELSRLHARLTDTLTGAGQITFVTGEAGFGKTALLHAFAHQAQIEIPSLLVAGGNCNAYTGIGDPYLPIRAVLALLVGDIATNQASVTLAPEQAMRLRQVAPTAIQALLEVAPDLVGTLLPPERLLACSQQLLPDSRPRELVQKLVTQKERERLQSNGAGQSNARPQLALFTQMTAFLQRVTAGQPLLLWLDDLHWADMGTVSLLMHLARNLQQCRLLIVGAFRPSEVMAAYNPVTQARPAGSHHPLEAVYYEVQRHLGEIEVALEAADGRAFVADLLDRQPNRLDAHFRERFYQYTQGNALFATELFQSMLARGDLVRAPDGLWEANATLDWETVPPRVEGVIAQRIARLPEELREALTLAGVEGENFHAEVVAALQGVDRRQMVRWLSSELDRQHGLVTLQGIETIGAQPVAHYRFRHILFQKYLYQQLDRAERIYLHGTVGATLETLYHDQPERIETLAGQLARHYEEAQQWLKAAQWLLTSSRRALRLSVPDAAILQAMQGVQLLQRAPTSGEQMNVALGLQLCLGLAYTLRDGYGSQLALAAYEAAERLCYQVGDTQELVFLLAELCSTYRLNARLQQSLDIGWRIVNLVEQKQERSLFPLAYSFISGTLVNMGRLAQARHYLELALAQDDLATPPMIAHLQSTEPKVVAFGYLPFALVPLGYLDRAHALTEEGIAYADKIGHPNSRAFAIFFAILTQLMRRDVPAAMRNLERLQVVAQQHESIHFWIDWSDSVVGWISAEQGDLAKSLKLLRDFLPLHRTQGETMSPLTWGFTALTISLIKAGEIDEGLTTVNATLELAERIDERWWEAELHRLHGELLLRRTPAHRHDPTGEAEAAFRRAIHWAQQQQTKLWELRATMSLVELYQRQNCVGEVLPALAKIYDWFTEGFATYDLQKARRLLQTLGR
jgi:DNA-binding SARP family transcriptional activator